MRIESIKLFNGRCFFSRVEPTLNLEARKGLVYMEDEVLLQDKPPVEEPPNEPEKPPFEEPEAPPAPPRPPNRPPVERPPNDPGTPPVKEPPH